MKDIAVASRYADALYEEAKAENTLDKVIDDLKQLQTLLETNKEFATFVSTAALTSDEKLLVINKLGAGVNRLTQGLLVVLVRNHRLALLAAVIEAVRKRQMLEKGEVEVKVDYASPVDDSVRAELKAQLTKLISKSVILKESVDPSLLGGLRVFVDSTMYDLSVRGKLDNLKAEFVR